MARYKKVSPRFWTDEKVVKLAEGEKLVALYCVTSPQTNRIGIFSLSPARAAEDLGITVEEFRYRLDTVCHTLNWQWDDTARVLYMPTWWKYNHPENPKHMLGNLKDLDELPKTALINLFLENLEYLAEPMQKILVDTVSHTVSDTVSKRYAIPEAEAVTETEAVSKKESTKHQHCSPAVSDGAAFSENASEPPPPPPAPESPPRKLKIVEKKPDRVAEWFEQFWKAYPRKVGRKEAYRAFENTKPTEPLLVTMLAAITKQKTWPKWTKDGGDFIPYPATWLNREQWLDEEFKPLKAERKFVG